MCSIGDDICSVYRAGDRKARKAYRCEECRRTIQAGETYRYAFMVFDSDACSFRTCEHCMSAAQWLVETCGGYAIGGLHEELIEHAREYNHFGLGRLVVGLRRGWRRFDGAGLMPPPAMPALLEGMHA